MNKYCFVILVFLFISSCGNKNEEYIVVLTKKTDAVGHGYRIIQESIKAKSDNEAYKEAVQFLHTKTNEDPTLIIEDIHLYNRNRELVNLDQAIRNQIESEVLPESKRPSHHSANNYDSTDRMRMGRIYVVYHYLRITMLRFEDLSRKAGQKLGVASHNNDRDGAISIIRQHLDSIKLYSKEIANITPPMELKKLHNQISQYFQSEVFDNLIISINKNRAFNKEMLLDHLSQLSKSDSELMADITEEFIRTRDLYSLDEIKATKD